MQDSHSAGVLYKTPKKRGSKIWKCAYKSLRDLPQFPPWQGQPSGFPLHPFPFRVPRWRGDHCPQDGRQGERGKIALIRCQQRRVPTSIPPVDRRGLIGAPSCRRWRQFTRLGYLENNDGLTWSGKGSGVYQLNHSGRV